jgi:hypothetical protein
MGEDPREIERDIEQTREHMGETVEALAYKADVPTRVKESVADKKDAVVGKLTGAMDKVTGGTSNAASRTGDVASAAGQRTKRAVGMAQQKLAEVPRRQPHRRADRMASPRGSCLALCCPPPARKRSGSAQQLARHGSR